MNELDIEIVRKKLKTSVILWFFFIVSILLYAGIVEWMQRSGGEAISQNGEVHLVFIIAAAFFFLAAGVAKYLLLRIPAQKPEWDTRTLSGRLVNASLISLALSEAICLMGFAEYFILRNYDSFYLFFIVSMLGMIMHMPRYPQWKSYLEQMTGTILPSGGIE
ncbi:MAG: hypothetical protein GXO70_03520 [Acidobacteria bacterium]|nr:hypothetical protein [Acidobacteriota bacterium]